MEELKVGDMVGTWFETECSVCGELFYVTRTEGRILKEGDLVCSSCTDCLNHQREIDRLELKITELETNQAKLIKKLKKINKILARVCRVAGWKWEGLNVRANYQKANRLIKELESDNGKEPS